MVNREFAALMNFLELLILMFGLISAVIAKIFSYFSIVLLWSIRLTIHLRSKFTFGMTTPSKILPEFSLPLQVRGIADGHLIYAFDGYWDVLI